MASIPWTPAHHCSSSSTYPHTPSGGNYALFKEFTPLGSMWSDLSCLSPLLSPVLCPHGPPLWFPGLPSPFLFLCLHTGSSFCLGCCSAELAPPHRLQLHSAAVTFTAFPEKCFSSISSCFSISHHLPLSCHLFASFSFFLSSLLDCPVYTNEKYSSCSLH